MLLILALSILAIAISPVVLWACHRTLLRIEARHLKPIGVMVNVDGFAMHVYESGPDSERPSIILLSESGNPAPVYDYKLLYAKLTDEYRVVVLEKFGYGYSDISGLPRDVKTMVNESRQALLASKKYGPYVLMPHSMSALEAIYWATAYPDEVKAIIGLDMALPETYEEGMPVRLKIINALFHAGFQRLPFIYSISGLGQDGDERSMHRRLMHKMAYNDDMLNESKAVYRNARTVHDCGVPRMPMLLLVSDRMSREWIASQYSLVDKLEDGRIIELDCDHDIHHHESELIARKSKEFLADVLR
jgi:pimeloyl-ACP methyl ester carboxylesterase